MQTKLTLKIVAGIAAVAILVTSSIAIAGRTRSSQSISLKSLSKQCRNSIDSDGFGHAKLGGVNFHDETAQIFIPCKVEIEDGSTVQFNNVNLTTSNLLIVSKEGAKGAAHVVFNRSQLQSSVGGLQIQLKPPRSSVTVSESSFKYPLSVVMTTGGGDDDTEARINISNSRYISNSKESEGLILSTTGKAVFQENVFETSGVDDYAILVGRECQSINNIQAITDCQDN
ncbi:MAG: hypothetical protein ABIQ89_04130 [Candidatus Saccharimonadales bacterium]